MTGTLIDFDKSIMGDLELILYNPVLPAAGFILSPASYIFFKDITIDSQKTNYSTSTEDSNAKKDTKYENVVNEDYINALDDIEFKITSKNDSELSYSKAMDGNTTLDVLTNNIYNTVEKPEKLLIQRIINQYKQPKIKLLQVIKSSILPYSIVCEFGKQFIFTGGTIDYEDNSIECNLIELN